MTMKKYHRLLIYSVFAGLTILLFIILSNTMSEKWNPLADENIEERIRKFRGPEVGGFGLSEKEMEGIAAADPEIRMQLRSTEAENNKRLERIEKTCREYNLGLYRTSGNPRVKNPPVPQYSVFYIDRANGFSYCPVYKAGSSTWLYNLCLLAGMSEEEIDESLEQLSVLARHKYPELEPAEAEEALQNTIKFMTVRHPFERLLSAYRDKLENTNHGREHGTLHFYRKFGRKIVKKYREKGNGTKVWELLKPSQYLWDPKVPKPAGVEPTFREFVKYLIDSDLLLYADDHWIPYHLFCTPCLLRYDVIAKVETMAQDQLYIIRLLRLEDKIRPRWRHKTQFMQGGKMDDGGVSKVSKVYFQQLSVAEVNSLYEKYKVDFELFGYDHAPYLRYAHDFRAAGPK